MPNAISTYAVYIARIAELQRLIDENQHGDFILQNNIRTRNALIRIINRPIYGG